MAAVAPAILDSLSALTDPARCRVLRVLDGQELTVSELCAVLQLPQSTVSRHLKTLADAGWVLSRRDGTSRYYSLTAGEDGDAQRQIWLLTRAELDRQPDAGRDARRLGQVLARRSEASQQFFASAAREWDRVREDLFGSSVGLAALPALLPATWTVGDLGCGTGAITAVLAPYVRRVIGVDASEEMLAAARERLAGRPHIDLRHGALEALPLDAASLDAATMMLVLHHLPSPGPALREAARALRPGGRLLVVDMTPHDREDYRREMGHVWLGFSPDQITRLLESAGFDDIRVHALPAAADAAGPALFAAVAANGIRNVDSGTTHDAPGTKHRAPRTRHEAPGTSTDLE